MSRGFRAFARLSHRLILLVIVIVTMAGISALDLTLADQAAGVHGAQAHKGESEPLPYTGNFTDLVTSIDNYWANTLDAANVPYLSPDVVTINGTVPTRCGPMDHTVAAAYCSADMTIYLVPSFLSEQENAIGDYASITILAHEWGHHVQTLTKAPRSGGSTFELQADCLAGVYTQQAEAQGLLEPGDITEAVLTAQSAGDPLWLPQDHPSAHGINDDRIKAFMRGYLNGLRACDLPIAVKPSSSDTVPIPVSLSRYLPLPEDLPVAYAACFDLQAHGEYPYVDVVAFLSAAGANTDQISALGWQDGMYIDFRCQSPPPGGADFLEVVLHRFATPSAASSAVLYWERGYVATNANELYICMASGQFLVCVDGRGPTGKPTREVLDLLDHMLATLPQT